MHSEGDYVVVKGKAGLGNRMLSAMTGVLYAQLCGRRIVVDWSDFTYSSDGSNAFPRLFLLPDSDAKLPQAARGSVSPAVWIGRLDKSATEVIEEIDPTAHRGQRGYRAFSVDLARLDHREQTLVMWSYNQLIPRLRRHFNGRFAWLAPKSDDEIMSWLLRKVMVLQPDIAADVGNWWAEHIDGRPVIGVHVRFMDRRTSIESFYKEIDKLLPQVPHATIFLATDNLAAQKDIDSRYPRVISMAKWFPTSGLSMHQNADCPDRLANAIEALRDMYLLARCDYLVYPGSSTFSYMSSLITTMPRSHIIDVERNDPVIQLKRFARRWLL